MKSSASALCLLLLAGCGNSGDEPAGQNQQLDKDHVLSTQTDALDKARGVEQDVLNATQRQREQIESDGN